MGKGLVSLGLLLIIVALLPIWYTFIAAYVDLSMILTYFDFGIYTLPLAGYYFTEVMLGLIVLGVIVMIAGARG